MRRAGPSDARGRHDRRISVGGVYAKPADAEDAAAMLTELAGRTHAVVSGLCLLTPAGSASSTPRRSSRSAALDGRDRGLRRERGVGGPRRRIRDPGPRRPARRADRGRLPERRRAARRAAARACSSARPRRCFGCGESRRVTDRRRAADGGESRPELHWRAHEHVPLDDRLRRSRHGRRPRHREHAGLRARPRHRALGAVGRRDRPADGRGARGRRRGEAHARPHARHRSPRSARSRTA